MDFYNNFKYFILFNLKFSFNYKRVDLNNQKWNKSVNNQRRKKRLRSLLLRIPLFLKAEVLQKCKAILLYIGRGRLSFYMIKSYPFMRLRVIAGPRLNIRVVLHLIVYSSTQQVS